MRFPEHTQTIEQLMTLFGDFTPPTGPVEQLEDGFRFANGELDVRICVQEHSSGVFLRRDTVKNVSSRSLTLHTALSRFLLDGWEKEVYTQHSQNYYESCGEWQSLVTEVSAHNFDLRSGFGGVPFAAVFDLQTRRGAAFHIADSCQWRFFIRKEFLDRPRIRATAVELGPEPLNFAYVLQPGESLTLPELVYYEFRNKTDMDAWKLHRWCKDTRMPRQFPVAYNTWMSKFGIISYDLLTRQLEIAKELGMEYFVIDAGWFCEGALWATGLGDWEESTEFGMQGRMREFADNVRAAGLKFGLWFEIERAGPETAAYKAHPEYYMVEESIALLDFANPKAADYIFAMLERNIRKYGIEYIKFDFNRTVRHDPNRSAFLKYYEGYGAFIRRIRETFPGIYLEGCASGGLRMTLSSLKYFDSFWMSDNQSQTEQLRIFRDTLLRMPPRALENWVSVCSLQNQTPSTTDAADVTVTAGDRGWRHVESITEDFLRHSMWGGPMSVSCDLTRLSPALRQSLAERAALIKTQRDYWRTAEARILIDTAAMLALQFSDEALSDLRIYLYAGAPLTQNAVTVFPVCDPDTVYADAEGVEYTGQSLMEEGLRIPMKANRDAAEVLLKKVK